MFVHIHAHMQGERKEDTARSALYLERRARLDEALVHGTRALRARRRLVLFRRQPKHERVVRPLARAKLEEERAPLGVAHHGGQRG